MAMGLFLDKLVSNMLAEDCDSLYKYHIAHLGNERLKLRKWAGKKINADKHIIDAINIAVNAATEADVLYEHYKFAQHKKEAVIFLNLIVKTLKIAEKVLAVLLLTSPIKIGLAYNALHQVVKYFELRIKKDKIRKLKGIG